MHDPKGIEIPTIFKHHITGEHFERCISCDTYLLESGTPYLIEKAVKKYPGYQATDVLFEYAMCMNCAAKMRQELSSESLQRIQQYFEQKVNFYDRLEDLEGCNDPQQWLSHCIITGKPIHTLDEYQLLAYCEGKQLQFSGMPYMISGQAADEMTHLLSNKTIGEINRFIDENFGLPPELRKPIKDQPVLLI